MWTEHSAAFDLWLHDVLTREYGTADADDVPDELLRLLPCDEDGEPN